MIVPNKAKMIPLCEEVIKVELLELDIEKPNTIIAPPKSI
jgi:hypothetical protein